MALETPRLDDRTFDDLVAEARARIPLYTPEWTDHNLSDPGMTLIELFAWMTDVLLYRLNRVPDKHFVKFMELIGMRLHEAEPARVPVTFWLAAPMPEAITIPSGTEVATVRTEEEQAIVFSTDGPMEIKLPQLGHVLTSHATEGGRAFIAHSAERVLNGYEQFPVFASATPSSGDALYLGFDNDLSHHILGIDIEVDTAQGAGIDPSHPPYVWEVLGAEVDQNWVRVDVDFDSTLGLNVSGLIRLHLPQLRRATREDRLAYWVRCRLDLSDMDSGYNVSPQINRLAVTSWGGTVNTTNVTVVRHEVMGRSDGTPGQTFFLEHAPILARTNDEYIMIRRDDGREERWQEVSNFSDSTAADRHYTIDSDTGEVRFGPALPQRDGQIFRYGALPPKDAMIVMTRYRYGGGQVGNVAANTLTVLKTALPYIEQVRNREPAKGGKDAEDLENAKIRVPGYLRSLGRAVTASDFEYLTYEAAPGQVGRAYCLQPPLTNRGEIKMLVIPHVPRLQGFVSPESLELPTDLRETIQAYLDERRLLSTQLEVLQPAYQWVETEVRFRASQHCDFEKTREAVEARLFEFLNPLTGGTNGTGWAFGRDLFVSDIMAVLLSVPGVNFVRSVKMYPIEYSNRQFTRGLETSEIHLPSHGVIVSYAHTVLTD